MANTDGFRLPYFPFYVADWLSSSKTARMTLEEEGAYIRLLCYQWQDGSIPSDPDERATLLGISGEAQARLWPRLEPCFETDGDGNLRNPRLHKERMKVVNRKKKLSRAGRKGRKKQLSGATPGPPPGEAQATSGAGPDQARAYTDTESYTEEESTGDRRFPTPGQAAGGNYPDEFEQVWSEYPKRGGGNPKKAAYRAWLARVNNGADPDELLRGTRRYADYIDATDQEHTRYVKQARTFFGPDEHWREDWEPPEDGGGEGHLSDFFTGERGVR